MPLEREVSVRACKKAYLAFRGSPYHYYWRHLVLVAGGLSAIPVSRALASTRPNTQRPRLFLGRLRRRLRRQPSLVPGNPVGQKIRVTRTEHHIVVVRRKRAKDVIDLATWGPPPHRTNRPCRGVCLSCLRQWPPRSQGSHFLKGGLGR